MSETTHPFETTENGLYIVPQQTTGQAPDSVVIVIGDTEYVLTGYCGATRESRVFPNVLTYKNMEVVSSRSEDSANSSSTTTSEVREQ